ncbi:helix-turn-helix domain-containing protein [Pseudochrobactrum algeriensis]|uniref:Transcriptional regulator with XRE-family HTH domain n=1 Tax=Pseudochrobactrum saccharolyticum TaxID=354352 RepID=A0A7W8EPA5_9HYPH|nr:MULTISPECIES: helix-turn-helix transcriptional regulator [Pseudochrobactrum]MBX8784381.1 helix-turn-helix transcriptional regulator [Ochrobactrum sp. GRS2]MBX8813659.1 helix-turn-helix transcriptional regulator [Ochrobactrum sp. MR34]KAB0540855.1 helix-turn-helix transcriptional regulator [Pseudochrobactrum saccharolyticum]MBB5090448.1 transcriptional regulator with XRE-family HTH domain [Pseudochrobactrum saccharolyticum]MDP8252350.1 helix-turn-helix domain-containing protein [Pseudochroba
MTPFGQRLRKLREERGVSQKEMATAIRVSAAYLSALEHGRRGQPTWDLLQRIIGYFNIIWDEAEELQNLAMISHPRVTIDTSGLSPEATELANLLANHIRILDRNMIESLSTTLRLAHKKHRSLR